MILGTFVQLGLSQFQFGTRQIFHYKTPKQITLFNRFELMDVLLVTSGRKDTFRATLVANLDIWVARKRVGNANGGS